LLKHEVHNLVGIYTVIPLYTKKSKHLGKTISLSFVLSYVGKKFTPKIVQYTANLNTTFFHRLAYMS